MKSFIMIRSAYVDDKLSRQRLGLSIATSIQSLAAQTCREFSVVLSVNRKDPHLGDRLAAFYKAVPDLLVCEVPQFKRKTYATNGKFWKLVSRMDDDDVIANNFIENIREKAFSRTKRIEGIWSYSHGFIFNNGKLHPIHYVGNMFITLQTEMNRTPFDFVHGRAVSRFKKRCWAVSRDRGWVWVRHRANKSPLSSVNRSWMRRNKPVDPPSQFPYDWDRIIKAAQSTECTTA